MWQAPYPNLCSHRGRLAHVALGVEMRDVGLVVAEEDLGLLEAEVLAEAGGVGVAELVGVPAVGSAPGGEIGLLLLGQAIPPLGQAACA